MTDEAAMPERSLRPILDQMVEAKDAGLHYIALMTALTLPDICAALSATDGQTSRKKYIAWLKAAMMGAADPEWIRMGGPPEGEAELIYGLRCSFLHQGRLEPHRSRVTAIFTVPNDRQVVHHANYVKDGDRLTHVVYYIPGFAIDMAKAVLVWARTIASNVTVLKNLEKFARVRLGGYPPIVPGLPVVM